MANRKITYEVGFTGDTSQLQAALKQAVASLQELGTNPQNLQRGLEGAAHAALELNNHLRNAYNADTGKLDLTRFRQELDKSGQTLEDYARQLRTLGPAGEQAFMQVATAIGAAELPLKRSNQLLNQLWVTMKNTARWRLTTGALNAFIGGLQQAFGYSKSLNASLNDIRIVTGKSADEMSRFAKEANQAAKELSTTTTTYTDASLIYYQQGLDSEAVKERTDATIKMANVTGQSAETISSQMTAVWNNFREGSRTLESYADTMVALGATTASSSKEIAEGLEKFAPIANSVGLSFDYASAALATLVATTRESASVAGNALKTLFSRLEGLKLGETLDDGTDLNKYSQALYTVGINIKDANGELKDMDLILSELGNRWKDLARDEQMALAQTVGGVRQYAQLVALMDNWQVFQQNLVTARTAEGSLDKQAQIYAESWEAARDRVKAATEDVYDSLINPKVFIDLDKLAQGILKPLASILDGVGGLTGLLPIAAALMTKVYSAQIANVMRDMAVNIGLMTGKEQERARAIQAQSAALAERLTLTYQDDSTAGQRVTVLQQWNSLQSEINSKSDSYTESQMEQAKNAQYMIGLIRDQSIALLDAKDKAEQLYDSVKNESVLSLGLPDSDYTNFFSHFIKLSSQAQQSLSSNFSSVKEWMGDLDKVFKDVNDELEVVVGRSVKINILKNSISEVNEQTEEWKIQVKELAVSLGLMAENEDITDSVINRLKNDLAGSHPVIQQTENDLTELKALLAELFGGGQRGERLANTLIGALERLLNASNAANTSVKHLTKSVEDFRSNPIPDITDWADTFVAVANGASRAAMAIRSFENVLDVLQDDTLSKSEKFIRVLTSLGMILPSIIPMVGLLGKSALKAGADVGTGATVAGTGIAAGVTAAKAAMPIAMALTIVIYGIVKAIDAFNNRQKNAQEEIKKTLDSLNEAKQELESLSNEVSTTQDRIKELQDLAASGSISIVEQEELRDLQIENDKLERQLELKKELARIKFTETRTQYQQSGGRAYVVPENDSQTKNYKDIWQTLPVFGENQLSFDEKQSLVNLLASGASLKEAEGYLSAAGLNDYYDTLVSVYDQIEAIREKNDAEWLNNVGETLSQAETLYEAFLDNVEDFSDADLRKLQGQLANLRKAFYGDQYGEKFVDPILGDIVKEDLSKLKGIYESTNLIEKAFAYQTLSQETKDLLAQYGIDAKDAGERFSETLRKAQEELNKFGLGSVIDSLGYQELDLIAKFEFQEDSEFTEVQQLFNFLRENAGIVPISLQVQTIEDARTEALTALASGELLSDEMIAKLQEVYAGVRDIANFSEMSVKDQIEFLTNEGKVAEKTIKDLSDRYEELDNQLNSIEKVANHLGKKLEDNPIYVATKLEFDEVEKELEKLKQDFERDPWKIRIEAGNEIGAQINNVKKALALINEDLTVNADNLVELAKRYPEALVEATYDQNQNLLKLDEERYNNLQTLLSETLDATRDINAQALLDAANTAFGILNIVKDAEDGKRDQSNITLDNILSNNQEQIDDIKRISLQALIEIAKSEKEKRQQQLDTMIQQVSGAKSAADTMAKNAEITAQNYSTAADTILRAFDTAFRNIAAGSAALASGQYTSIWQQGWNRSSAEYKLGESDLSVYQKNVADVKSSTEYKTLEAEIKLIDPLIDALQNYYETGEGYNKVLDALEGFSSLPNEIVGVLENLNLNIGDISTGAASIFGDGFVDALTTGFSDNEAIKTAFETMLDDPRTAEALQNATQTVYDDLVTALSNLLESPEVDKTKGGSGGKPDYVKLDKADLDAEEQTLEEIEDRYHEITREIERQERVLTKLEHQIDRTYGLDRLKLYEQEIKDLNKLQDDQRIKSARAERYLKDVDTDRLINAFQATGYSDNLSGRLSARGIGFAGSSSYDIENAIKSIGKEITNFEEVERYINQDMNNFMSAYTDFMKQYDEFVQKYEAMTDEEKLLVQAEAEQWKLDYELLQDQFKLVEAQQEERLAAIEQYESTLDTINTLAHEIEDTARRIEDAKLNEITYRMDVILDVRDARKQIRDFTKEIAESFGDALTHGVRTAELGWDQAKDEMAMYKEYVQEYNDLKGLLDNANEFTDTTAIIDELKELEGNIIESGQRLLEWTEQVENMFVEALSAAADRFSYFTSQLEHNDAILSTIKELYALQGQTYKTQQGFNRLQRVSQERLEAQIGQAKLQRKWFEEADSKLQEAQAQLDALIAEKGAEAEQDVRYDALKKNRDALLEQQRQAQSAMLDAAKEAMETTRQMYLDEIEKMSYDLEQRITNGVGFDLLQEKYDHFIEEQDRYLDPVEEALETAKWYAKLQQDIDKTSNKAFQDKFKALQKEIDLRRENNTLSQYDLDLLEAKYKVLQAFMDLEDARNNKNQLRLVRDSQGNWNYQFTANPDDIKNQEEEMLKALQNEFDITKQRYSDLTSEFLRMIQEFAEKDRQIREDMANGILTEEEGEARLKELERYYTEKANYLKKELSEAEIDMNSAAIRSTTLAATLSESVYQTSDAEIKAIVDNFKNKHTPELLKAGLTSFADFQQLLTENIGDFNEASRNIKEALLSIITSPNQDGEGLSFAGLVNKISEYNPTIKDKLEEWVTTFATELGEEGIAGEFGNLSNLIASIINDDSDNGIANAFETLSAIAQGYLLEDGISGDLKELTDNAKSYLLENGLKGIVGQLTGNFTTNMNNMTKSIRDNFIPAIEYYIPRAEEKFDNYQEKVSDVADECGTSLENLDEQINIVSDSTDEITWRGYEAAVALWQQVDAAWDAQLAYLDLAEAVWEYIDALRELAAERVVPTIEEASGVDTFDNDDWLDYEGDLSQKMAAARYNEDWESYNKFKNERAEAVSNLAAKGITVNSNEMVEELFTTLTREMLKAFAEGDETAKELNKNVVELGDKWQDVYEETGSPTRYKQYASGGYTGNFDGGRLAILHEKELVLNAEDTQNILSAVSLVRSMDDIFGSIAEQLDNDGLAAMALLGSRVGGIGAPAPASTDFEQHVTIESVSFPGVTSSREIEEAFESLVNDAAQWARRRKS